MSDFRFRLYALAGQRAFVDWRRGVEKEALRVTRRGELATTPHPTSLGSPLTNPKITTDFSEAQLEIISGVHRSTTDCLAELDSLHRFAYSKIGTEYLWPASMPCFVGGDKDVPIAYYGESNTAKIKSIYRMGLANRYGRRMQTISGIHYNFSLSNEFWSSYAETWDETDNVEFRNARYMDLIRNFRRFAWLPIYLFGASPAVCKSFAPQAYENLEEFDEGSNYLPYATSLRMGPLGYQSEAQTERYVSYNSLEAYIRTVLPLLTEQYPAYMTIGLKRGDDYQQLNTALLQIEAEFYGTIRAKRKSLPGERPLEALKRRGVEYVEVRCLDLNPFHPVGISLETMDFLDLFLVYCLLCESPSDDMDIARANVTNQELVVNRGRESGLRLHDQGKDRILSEWAAEILREVEHLAEFVDQSGDGADRDSNYVSVVQTQTAKVDDPEKTPSKHVLRSMEEKEMSYSFWGLYQARAHQDHYLSHPVETALATQLETLAESSMAEQVAMEAADTEPFDVYLEQYLLLDV